MLRIAILLVLVTNVLSAEICDRWNSDDISDFSNNTDSSRAIYANGVKYAANQYYHDENTNTLRGCSFCVNSDKICIRKCCAFGFGYHIELKKCVSVKEEFHAPVWNKYKLLKGKHVVNSFKIIIGNQDCSPDAKIRIGQMTKHIHVKEDGSLYVEIPGLMPPFLIFTADKYCIDTFVYQNESGAVTTRLDALTCYAEEQKSENYVQSATCMLISCVFILATCAVYAFLPELRNLHGRVLLAYLVCLFVGFVFLATMQILILLDRNSQDLCLTFTFIIYFSLLSAFFWLNVMCFDIWWTFSGNRAMGKLSKRDRFCAYAVYAFGIPTVLTIVMAALEFSGLPAHFLMPMISIQGCFLAGTSKLIYLYGPIVILCAANMTFFVLTALKIRAIRKQTSSVLQSRDSSTHDQHRNDKQRLSLYLKLFIVMGINWILEVASACFPEADNIWRVTDAYNVLIGIPIFIIFVFKRKIYHLLKKRYRQIRGDSISRTTTTVSSRTVSRDDMHPGSIKLQTK